MSGIPHERQGIELAVERTLSIETAGARLTLEGGTVKPFSVRIGHEGHLAALRVGKGG
jgi:hypothetical protein